MRTIDRPKLFINHQPEHDTLDALEFGRVPEGQPSDAWRDVEGHPQVGLLTDNERVIGFQIQEFEKFDPNDSKNEELWRGERFDAPMLGLTGATIAEIAVASRNFFEGHESLNRFYFNQAIGVRSDDKNDGEARHAELNSWWCCLQAGDSMAHFGFGAALFEAGIHRRAYTHLRYYATIAPAEPWAHLWHAKAALAIGETAEAAKVCQRALELADVRGAEEGENIRREVSDVLVGVWLELDGG